MVVEFLEGPVAGTNFSKVEESVAIPWEVRCGT